MPEPSTSWRRLGPRQSRREHTGNVQFRCFPTVVATSHRAWFLSADNLGREINVNTQPEAAEQHLITFTVRLGLDDWDRSMRGWRCSALEISGSTVEDIFSDGDRVDKERYRVIDAQRLIRWVSEAPPEKVSVLVRVDSETKADNEKARIRAENAERWWRRFGILVPIIVALIAAAVALISKSAEHTLQIGVLPADAEKQLGAARATINGAAVKLPYQSPVKGNIDAQIDLNPLIQAAHSLQPTQRASDQERRLREYVTRVSQILAGTDGPLTQASGNIIDSCSGGSHGVTPSNGTATINLINSARNTIGQLKAEADTILRP